MSRCVVCDRKPCSVYCGSGIDDLGDEIDRLKAENEKLKYQLEKAEELLLDRHEMYSILGRTDEYFKEKELKEGGE